MMRICLPLILLLITVMGNNIYAQADSGWSSTGALVGGVIAGPIGYVVGGNSGGSNNTSSNNTSSGQSTSYNQSASNGSSGAAGTLLAQGLYCDTKGLLEGNIGLLLGLILVFIGIWALVQGAKMIAVLPVILIGSLVTALPSVIESSFEGLGSLLSETNISTKTFSPPDCTPSGMTGTDNHPGKVEDDTIAPAQPGVFYPGQGIYPALPLIGPVPTPRPNP